MYRMADIIAIETFVAAARKQVAELYAADPDRRLVLQDLLHLISTACATQP